MKVSEAISALGYKIKPIYEKAGFSEPTFRRRNKKGNWSAQELQAIADAMNVKFEELLQKIQEQKPDEKPN